MSGAAGPGPLLPAAPHPAGFAGRVGRWGGPALEILAVLVLGSAIGLAAVSASTATLLLAGALGAALVALGVVPVLRPAVFVLLAGKPLIDLTWKWQVTSIAGQRLNLQTAVAFMPLLLAVALWLLRPAELVWSRALAALLVLAAAAVAMTPSATGINELLRFAGGATMFGIAGVLLDQGARFDRFVRCFLLAVSVPVLLCFLQRAGHIRYEYWDWLGYPVGRVSGTYPHPLGLISFLYVAIPMALYLAERPGTARGERLLLGGFVAAGLLATVFTYHRTGLLTIAAELVAWLLLTRRRWLALAMVAGGLTLVIAERGAVGLLYENVLSSISVPYSSPYFLRGRGMNWYLFLRSFSLAHPLYWLIGKGGSAAEGFVSDYGYLVTDEPHNDFIRLLHAYGIVGLGLYLAVLARFLVLARELRRRPDPFGRGLGNLLVVVVLGIALLSLTSEPTRAPSGSWYVFALGSAATVQLKSLRQAGSPTGSPPEDARASVPGR